MVAWHIPVLLTIGSTYILLPILNKSVAHLPGRARNLVWQYFFAAIFIGGGAILISQTTGADGEWGRGFVVVLGIGAVNAFACYCYWRAAAISLSVTSISTWVDDVIALALGFWFLQETQYLNSRLVVGVALALAATIIFSLVGTKRENFGHLQIRKILFWVALYSVIWGGAEFSMRYFALRDMPLFSYVAAWYGGSFLGALVVFAFSDKEERGDSFIDVHAMIRVIPLALLIGVSLSFQYWAKMLAPITVSTPILQVAEMIFPTIIGLILFKERKNLNGLGWLAMTVGVAGGLVIALSFQ